MCFIEKMNCIKIRKREDRVSDSVRTPGRVLGCKLLTITVSYSDGTFGYIQFCPMIHLFGICRHDIR